MSEAVAKRGPGQPTKFTPERVEIILKAAREGVSRKGQAHLARVAIPTLDNWIAMGRQAEAEGEENEYLEFLRNLEEAEASVEQRCSDAILRRVKDGDIQAAKYWLGVRRKWREPSTKLQHSGKVAIHVNEAEVNESLARIEEITGRTFEALRARRKVAK